ncbi:uncharacterized protein METZ01_LOCUS248484, partial [marine metagenome]
MVPSSKFSEDAKNSGIRNLHPFDKLDLDFSKKPSPRKNRFLIRETGKLKICNYSFRYLHVQASKN